MSTAPVKFRQANPVDKEVIQRISADAYVPAYMAVLGTIPKPATEDYGPRVDKGEVWILEVQGEPTGIAVLEESADHLLIYSPPQWASNIARSTRSASVTRGRPRL